jgi:hypothetical protein
MSDLIRELMGTMLPADVVAQLGDYLDGHGISDVMAQQAGNYASQNDPSIQMAMLNSGKRPNPMVNSVQLDR